MYPFSLPLYRVAYVLKVHSATDISLSLSSMRHIAPFNFTLLSHLNNAAKNSIPQIDACQETNYPTHNTNTCIDEFFVHNRAWVHNQKSVEQSSFDKTFSQTTEK
jgi:hypothetical protein